MSDFLVAVQVIVVGMLLVLVFLTPLVGLAAALDRAVCYSKAEKMNLPSSWGPFQGCMVKTSAGWRPISIFRSVEEAK